MQLRRWSDDLPLDVLREIAANLHIAADFIRFHAVCKPWCDSRDLLSRTTTTPKNQFLPWLLASNGKHDVPVKLRCVFSKSSYRTSTQPPRRTWVATADGHALRYLTVNIIWPRLHDPLTGATTDLPPFSVTPYRDDNWGENSCGIVYRDGTTLLYTVSCVSVIDGITRFTAVLLRPGDTKWTFLDRSIQTTSASRQGEFCATYHEGRIFVTAEGSLWRAITPDGSCDVLVPRPWMSDEHNSISEQYNYVLEYHGHLLFALVRLCYTYQYPIGSSHVHTLFVVVHELEEASTPGKMRWVRKDGRSLADRVLFLGSPNSFAVDASLLRDHGGCAYFVYYNSKASKRPFEVFGVFKYNLVDGKSELLERLPRDWDNEKCTWIIPQPTIAPIQEIDERNLEAPKLKKQQQKTITITSPTHIIHIERHCEPGFKVLVKNLPHGVTDLQLECFFNKHGKVSKSEIIDYNNTKTSNIMGFVTMSTTHVHRDDTLAALEGLVLDGSRLEVTMVNDGPRR